MRTGRVHLYLYCVSTLAAHFLILISGLYIGVRSGMDSETQPPDHRPTRFSVRPPAIRLEKDLWIQRVELYLKEANVPDRKKGQELVSLLENEAFCIVSQMGYDAIDYIQR